MLARPGRVTAHYSRRVYCVQTERHWQQKFDAQQRSHDHAVHVAVAQALATQQKETETALAALEADKLAALQALDDMWQRRFKALQLQADAVAWTGTAGAASALPLEHTAGGGGGGGGGSGGGSGGGGSGGGAHLQAAASALAAPPGMPSRPASLALPRASAQQHAPLPPSLTALRPSTDAQLQSAALPSTSTSVGGGTAAVGSSAYLHGHATALAAAAFSRSIGDTFAKPLVRHRISEALREPHSLRASLGGGRKPG